MWEMENALRDECGYAGTIPYWDSPRFSDDQTRSKVFDGSDTSFGGNGEFLAEDHGPFAVIIPGLVANITTHFPAGTGGGCVQDGPFVDWEISLGPVDKPYVDPENKYGYEANVSIYKSTPPPSLHYPAPFSASSNSPASFHSPAASAATSTPSPAVPCHGRTRPSSSPPPTCRPSAPRSTPASTA